jgi:hypothetical protein
MPWFTVGYFPGCERKFQFLGSVVWGDMLPEMTPPQQVRGNPDLVKIVQSKLVPEFRRHGKHRSRTERAGEDRPAYFDPWWWPLDPANEPADWGLLPHQRDQFLSLCDVKLDGNKLPGFTGTLGAKKGCVWVIGQRPSFDNRYGFAIRFLRQKLQPLAELRELAQFLGKPPVFHITDLIKFRGNEGKAREDMCSQMVDISVDCLYSEFAAVTPAMILITDFAEELLPFVKDKLHGLDSRLDVIVNHPMKIVVPYWSREPHHEWADRILNKLKP